MLHQLIPQLSEVPEGPFLLHLLVPRVASTAINENGIAVCGVQAVEIPVEILSELSQIVAVDIKRDYRDLRLIMGAKGNLL